MKQSRGDQGIAGKGQSSRVRAWIAEARVAVNGGPCRDGQRAALFFFCISVHEDAARVPSGTPSLWVFPGGYFGFEASTGNWNHLDDLAYQRIERGVRRVLRRFPKHATVAFGVDTLRSPTPTSAVLQQAWVVQPGPGGSPLFVKVTREESPLEHRQVTVGPLEATFFICGEFTGSRTAQNGPFFIDSNGAKHFLFDPVAQLPNCGVLVDLAHSRVSGSVSSAPSRRMVTKCRWNAFSPRGTAVLSHHHGGRLLNGRAHFKHQSNWIIYRGGQWLDAMAVTEI